MRQSKQLFVAVVALFIVLGLSGCDKQEQPDFSGYKKIADLATIDCTFHNVAEIYNDGTDIIFGINVGYKKAWFEYDGSSVGNGVGCGEQPRALGARQEESGDTARTICDDGGVSYWARVRGQVLRKRVGYCRRERGSFESIMLAVRCCAMVVEKPSSMKRWLVERRLAGEWL